MALHIFNVSVDMPDAQPDYVPEDLSVNDQETFVELFLEKVLGIDNAIAEHDEQDDDQQSSELSKDLKLYSSSIPTVSVINEPGMPVHLTPFNAGSYYEYFEEINPPPPKA